jgi:signal transduction histidine kinase/ActR/RegA family two-component response regulator
VAGISSVAVGTRGRPGGPLRGGALAPAESPAASWSAQLWPALLLLPVAACAALLLHQRLEEKAARLEAKMHLTANALIRVVEERLGMELAVLGTLAQTAGAGEPIDIAHLRLQAEALMARRPAWEGVALTDGDRTLLELRRPLAAEATTAATAATAGLPREPGGVGPGPRGWSGSIAFGPGGFRDGVVVLRTAAAPPSGARPPPTLAAIVAPSAFAGLLPAVALPRGLQAVLTDANGTILADSRWGDRMLGRIAPSDYLRLSQEAPGQIRPVLSQDGEAEHGLMVPVGTSGWHLGITTRPERRDLSALMLAGLLAWSVLGALGLGGLALRRRYRVRAEASARRALELRRNVEIEHRRNEFLITISHELRTPLTGLLGYLELLSHSDLSPQQRAWVAQQRLAGQALLGLVGDIGDFARLEDGVLALEITDLDLPALLDDCVAMLRPAAEQKRLRLRSRLDPGLPRWVKGDPQRLRQVVTNLLGNAVKFTAQGDVTLSARIAGSPASLTITVADTGIGIAPERLPGIFDRIRRTDAEAGASAGTTTARRQGGSGLGLAIARRLVEGMGGGIWVESTPGQGSRFSFAVPLRPGQAPAPCGGLRVLVAEDVAASRLLLRAVLERAGHHVTAVENGTEALAVAQRGGFDILLLDLHMPGIEGLDAARALRSLPDAAGRVPLVALTADEEAAVEEACRIAGFDAVIRKPFETRRLLGVIGSLTGRKPASPEPTPPGVSPGISMAAG